MQSISIRKRGLPERSEFRSERIEILYPKKPTRNGSMEILFVSEDCPSEASSAAHEQNFHTPIPPKPKTQPKPGLGNHSTVGSSWLIRKDQTNVGLQAEGL